VNLEREAYLAEREQQLYASGLFASSRKAVRERKSRPSIANVLGILEEGSDLDSSESEHDSDSGSDRPPNVFDAKPLPRLRSERSRNDGSSLRSAIHDGVLTTNVQESTSHIFLKSLEISAIFQFILQLSEYEARNGVRPSAAPRVSEYVRQRVITCPTVPVNDELMFVRLSEAKLMKYIQRTVRPLTVPEFSDKLRRAVTFPAPEKFELTKKTFESFFAYLMTYSRNFLRAFLFLSHNNEKNIPAVDNKSGGLIAIYLHGIPGDFAKSVMSELRVQTASSIRSFIEDKFIPKVHKLMKNARNLKMLDPFVPDGPSSSRRPASAPTSSTVDKNSSSATSHGRYPYFKKRSTKPHDGSLANLNAVAQPLDGFQSDDTSVTERTVRHTRLDNVDPSYPNSSSERASAFNQEVDSDSENYAEEEPMKSVPTEDLDVRAIQEHTLQNISASSQHVNTRGPGRLIDPATRELSDRKVTGVCYVKLSTGVCNRSDCTFLHNSDAIRLELDKLVARWGKNGSSTPYEPPTRPPPKKPPPWYLNSLISPANLVERFCSSIQHMLSYRDNVSRLVQAVFHEGDILLPKEATLPFKALLDSGALQSSYMSKDFHRRHWDALQTFTERCEQVVTMADNVTQYRIRNRVNVRITMRDAAGVAYTFSDTCAVIDTAHDVIIGLPSIIQNVLPLFTDALYAARDSAETTNPDRSSKENDANGLSANVLIQHPWSNVDQDAPEDDAPVPCSFSEPLHYLSISHDQAVEEYLSLLDSHVDKEFAKRTEIISFLKSPIAIDAFVPSNWKGIKMPPVTLRTKDTMPPRYKPPPRNVNPKIWDVAKKEFERLRTYFYVPSDSPRVSPVVIAPKATNPFIRFAGDYSIWVNQHMLTGHWPIPNVRHSLEKIQRYRLFGDIDLTNGFHQIPISEETSSLLSVQTPWGTVRPLFLPEGVPQGSGLLQEIMMEIFGEFDDWTIVIFDNLLVLAVDYDDMYEKIKIILERAVSRNLVFKMKKTWLGVHEVTFFGYVCKENTFSLSEERLQGITAMQMPRSIKGAKQFLGSSGFFLPFVPNYSLVVAPLHDMTKLSFDWRPETWKVDYVEAFEKFKEALKTATTLFYPDYELDWILRADASELGVGIVLFQVHVSSEGNVVHQPILFASKKFSDQAKKWSTYAQESYAMYFAFKTCEYYIRGKPFTYEGDHANLQWMERSTEAKVIRQRLYMQQFPFTFNHIPGKQNTVADWQSRFEALYLNDVPTEYEYDSSNVPSDNVWSCLHAITNVNDAIPENDSEDVPKLTQSRIEMLREAHVGRAGHLGIRRTYDTLNVRFPGHGIPISQVVTFKENCPVCQKTEDYMNVQLQPITRHLKTTDPGRVVGIDYLTVVLDKFGNNGAYVCRDHFTKFVYVLPVPSHDAENATSALFNYCVLYGAFDILMSDPGSELLSSAVSQLNSWFGIHHRVSLVDRHESNGVEGANKQLLRHLRKLFVEERIKDEWSSPKNVGWAVYLMNRYDRSESGFSPYELTFGTVTRRRFNFPDGILDQKQAHAYVRLLNESLKTLTSSAAAYQADLVHKRVGKEPSQNQYQPGDLVLFRLPRDKPLPHKLHPTFLGPYEVLSHDKNDVTVRHLASNKTSVLFVSDLKAFFGSREEARKLASIDADQYLVSAVTAYRGDSSERASMYFHVEYADGDKLWVPWSRDLQNTEAYHDFCSSVPALQPLVFTGDMAKKWTSNIKKSPITSVTSGSETLIDLRAFGYDWYSSLQLPDSDFHTYLVPATYGPLSKDKRSISLECALLKRQMRVDNLFVTLHGNSSRLPSRHTVVDATFLTRFPALLSQRPTSHANPTSYEYLVDRSFYDPDAKKTFHVTRIGVTKTRDIVAYVRPIRPDGRLAREDTRPYHVADVINMLPQ
jgi:hypothetical protein